MSEELRKYVGMPVKNAVSAFSLAEGDLFMVDEPPGVLSGVGFYIKDRRGDSALVVLWVDYCPELVSERRRWPFEKVLEARIAQVSSNFSRPGKPTDE